jgi:hypothetical protein
VFTDSTSGLNGQFGCASIKFEFDDYDCCPRIPTIESLGGSIVNNTCLQWIQKGTSEAVRFGFRNVGLFPSTGPLSLRLSSAAGATVEPSSFVLGMLDIDEAVELEVTVIFSTTYVCQPSIILILDFLDNGFLSSTVAIDIAYPQGGIVAFPDLVGGSISIPTFGNGNPYPSSISASSRAVSKAVIKASLSHTWAADIDLLVEGIPTHLAMLLTLV